MSRAKRRNKKSHSSKKTKKNRLRATHSPKRSRNRPQEEYPQENIWIAGSIAAPLIAFGDSELEEQRTLLAAVMEKLAATGDSTGSPEKKTTKAKRRKAAVPTTPIEAQTTTGLITGEITGDIRTWRGIPYGESTTGEGRFRAPKPAVPWQDARDCTHYGNVAAQPTYSPSDKIRGSEECLNLDIVRPNTDEVLPVVVYLHGGSFIYGSSHEQLLRGHELAKDMNVVYVSINFRLGALGYLDMRSLGDDCVANPALLDQLLALQWVQENIAYFGGDQDNVTLMGESAGAAAVLTLMCVPAAQGLFHRAIAQSPPIATIHQPAQSASWVRILLEKLALPETATLEDLREIDAAEIIRAGQSMMWRGGELLYLNSCYASTVDNHVLFEHPLVAFQNGNQAKIPLIIGTNGDEASIFKSMYVRPTARERAARRMLEVFDPEGTDQVLDAYGGATARKDFADLVSDALFWAPALAIASAHARVAPTWMYRFDFAPLLLRWLKLGAMHSLELTPLFGDVSGSRVSAIQKLGDSSALEDVSAHMQKLWSEFMRTGVPMGNDWPKYTVSSDTNPGRATRIFDADSHVVYDPDSFKRRAWEKYDLTQWGAGRPELLQELGMEFGQDITD